MLDIRFDLETTGEVSAHFAAIETTYILEYYVDS